MKRLLIAPCALVFVLLLSASALANDWTPINDELEIDYQTHTLRVFVIGKDGQHEQTCGMARKMTLNYIGTLTDGKDNIKLADVFKTRKPIVAKAEALVNKGIPAYFLHTIGTRLSDGTYACYYTFDLKTLKTIFPDINLPSPGN